MITLLLFILYVAMSASGLLLIKMGADGGSLTTLNGILNIQISFKLVLGLIIYVCSFILSIIVMSRMKLSVFYPIGAGSILVLTCLLGVFFLREQLGLSQIIGILLVLCGVIVINI